MTRRQNQSIEGAWHRGRPCTYPTNDSTPLVLTGRACSGLWLDPAYEQINAMQLPGLAHGKCHRVNAGSVAFSVMEPHIIPPAVFSSKPHLSQSNGRSIRRSKRSSGSVALCVNRTPFPQCSRQRPRATKEVTNRKGMLGVPGLKVAILTEKDANCNPAAYLLSGAIAGNTDCSY
jgi:hypothetical protein